MLWIVLEFCSNPFTIFSSFLKTVSLYTHCYPRTCYVDQSSQGYIIGKTLSQKD